MSNLIAISGKQNLGKDTIGKMIQLLDAGYTRGEALIAIHENDIIEGQSDWEIKKMGYKLKQIASILLNVPVEKFEDQEYKKQTLNEQWTCWEVNYNIDHPAGFADQWGQTKIFPTKDEAINWAEDERLRYSVDERKMTPRLLLQLLGTECGRKILHPHIWSNALFADYEPKLTQESLKKVIKNVFYDEPYEGLAYPKWIITDIRFPNEAKAVKDRDGILIRVNREIVGTHICKYCEAETEQADYLCWNAPDQHPSETALDDYKDWDYIIDNNGTLDELLTKVKEIYEQLG